MPRHTCSRPPSFSLSLGLSRGDTSFLLDENELRAPARAGG